MTGNHEMANSTRVHLGLFVLILMIAGTAYAQVTTGTISGVVKDSTGAVLPGATVTVKNLNTGLTRTIVCDDQGRYYAPNLALGDYQLQAELMGFQTEIRRGVKLTVGREAVVDFTLKVGEITEKVLVVGEAPLVETSSPTLAGLVDDRTIRDLPLNGRSFTQLAMLEAGVGRTVNVRQEINKGFGPKISFAGARPEFTGFLLDGTDIKNETNFQTPASAAGVLLGVDTVREFQVVVSSYSAEYGRTAGGVVNAVTRSGTNELHGSVFEFHRNSALDARNFFDPTKEPPEFKRNQFGFTIGGPLKKDRSFFFGSYEGLRERLAMTQIVNVPTAEARRGRLPGRTVQVSPSVVPFLSLWPLPNGRDFGDGTGEFLFASNQPKGEDFFVVKIDHNFSEKDSFFARYSFDDAVFTSPSGRGSPNFVVDAVTRAQYTTVEEKKIISPNLVNLFRFAYNRTKIGADDRALRPIDKSLFFVPGPFFGKIRIGNEFIVDPGVDGKWPRNSVLNLFQYIDTLTYTKGRHILKAGISASRYQYNEFAPTRLGGEYQYDSWEDFLRARPRSLRIAAPGSDWNRGWRQNILGFFVQDEFKLSSRLTLNLGLRYEFITAPTEVHDKIANLRDIVNDRESTVGPPLFENPSLGNLAPRIGFAWDPFGNGKTSIRAGFGIFYNQFTPALYRDAGSRQLPFALSAQIRRPVFPNALEALRQQPSTEGLSQPEVIDFNIDQPYLMQYNLTIQREFASGTVLTISYAGSRGNHLVRLIDDNQAVPIRLQDGRFFFPPGLPRRNPAFSKIHFRPADGQSFYNSMQIKINRRFSSGLQFQASYTLSKSIDDAATGIGATDYTYRGSIANPYDRKSERGLSNFDIRNNLVLNWTYELPLGRDLRGSIGQLARGWRLSSIVSIASGSPFPLRLAFDRARSLALDLTQRPDLVPGRNSNPIRPGNPDQYFDPTAFALPEAGFYGNLGRNTTIGPGLASVDFAAVKSFYISEQKSIQFRAELFNLFNRANFAIPSVLDVFDSSGRVASAGRITETETTSRQIQFALKFIF